MIDGIIAGTGNSRLVKSVPNFLQLYPTYEAFVGALIAGTLPLDIIFNSPGWQQLPDFLNKTTLLQDATAQKYGFTGNTTVDDVLNRISTQLGGYLVRVYVQIGGAPAPSGISVTGMTGVNNEPLVTGDDGSVLGLTRSNTVTITVDNSNIPYVDVQAADNTFTIDTNYQAYTEATVNLVASAQGFIAITASKSVSFSPSTKTVDLFLVGGGRGGDAIAYFNRDTSSGTGTSYGGYGGSKVTQLGVSLSSGTLTCTIGAGGPGGYARSTVSGQGIRDSGANGGNTRVVVDGKTYTASGGSDTEVRYGSDGAYPFGSSAFGNKYGANGGGASANPGYTYSTFSGGTSGGGNGSSDSGGDATDYGSGGGGGVTMGATSVTAQGGDGYQGIVIIRWGY